MISEIEICITDIKTNRWRTQNRLMANHKAPLEFLTNKEKKPVELEFYSYTKDILSNETDHLNKRMMSQYMRVYNLTSC